MLSILALGLLFGMRHTIEADHLAAVATLTSNTKSVKVAVRQGVLWGIGHTVTLFAFCSIVLFFDSAIPHNLASMLEFAVGLMLLVLGIDMIRRTYNRRIHFHVHQHESTGTHFHAHTHEKNKAHTEKHEHEHANSSFYRPLLVGMMHGLAGTAALMMLAFQSVEGTTTALLYTLIFGVGSIIGMALLSVVIVLPFRSVLAKKMTHLYNGLHYALGSITLCIGVMVAIENVPLLSF